MSTVNNSPITTNRGQVDRTSNAAIDDLPTTGTVSGEQAAQMIRRATEDLDAQAAGLEHTDIMEWARDNWSRLSPEAKKMIEIYDKAALNAMASGTTGMPAQDWEKMMGEIDALVPQEKPKAPESGDATANAAIKDLKDSHGPISGERMQAAIEAGTGDFDAQAAGTEFDAFMKFQSENRSRLSPEAVKVLEIYEKYARAAQAAGQTGIQPDQWEKMMTEMKAVKTYNDQGAGVELDALGKKGMVGGKDVMNAIDRGTRDIDGQAAGLEFADFEKWAHDNAGRLGGSAKDVLAIYEKYARAAQAEGRTGLTPDEHKEMLTEMKRAIDNYNQPVEAPQAASGGEAISFGGGSWDEIFARILSMIDKKENALKEKAKAVANRIDAQEKEAPGLKAKQDQWAKDNPGKEPTAANNYPQSEFEGPGKESLNTELAAITADLKKIEQLVNMVTNLQKTNHETNMVPIRAFV